MPVDISHFSMVGFPFEAADERAALDGLVTLAQKRCRPVVLDSSHLDCVMTDPSGGELHLAIKRAGAVGEFVTLNPAYSGQGHALVEISADNSDPAWRPFEISVAARFAGEETPLVFDLAEPAQASAFKAGAKLSVSISAFSYEPQVHTDEAAYYAAQKKGGTKAVLAANYFIPSGMFFQKVGGAMPDGAKRPESYADFAGKVLKAEFKTNSAGSKAFWWALVETYQGATIDVVIDPASISLSPKAGSVVSGRFWLSARATSDPKMPQVP